MNNKHKYLESLRASEHLNTKQAAILFTGIFLGSVKQEDVLEILTILEKRGETEEELYGVLQAYFLVNNVNIRAPGAAVTDICGTGGDGYNLFNCSTVAAIIAASAGACIIKHCGRGVTSVSGSRDLLDSLGIKLEQDPYAALRRVGSGGRKAVFLRSSLPEKAEAVLRTVRKQIDGSTILNRLGAVGNLTMPLYRVCGVTSPAKARVVAKVFKQMNLRHAIVVSGDCGIDKLSISGKTFCCEIRGSKISEFTFDPRSVYIAPASLSELAVTGPSHSYSLAKDILWSGKGPHAQMACLNAGAALYVRGLAESIAEGYKMSWDALGDHKAYHFLQGLSANA